MKVTRYNPDASVLPDEAPAPTNPTIELRDAEGDVRVRMGDLSECAVTDWQYLHHRSPARGDSRLYREGVRGTEARMLVVDNPETPDPGADIRNRAWRRVVDHFRELASAEETSPSFTGWIAPTEPDITPGRIVVNEPRHARMVLDLYHGRTNPDEDMEDMGYEGPDIPIDHFWVTYMRELRVIVPRREAETLVSDYGLEIWDAGGSGDTTLRIDLHGDMLVLPRYPGEPCPGPHYFGDWRIYPEGRR